MMVEEKYLEVLWMIYSRLAENEINWALTGSLGMALQGVNVDIHDIDLQSDKRGAYEIEKCFSEYCVKQVSFSEAGRIRSHYGALEINGIPVEIMGAVQKQLDDRSWEEPVNVEEHKHWIMVDGMKIPVLSLGYEYQAYRILGREDKAKILRQWLQNEDMD